MTVDSPRRISTTGPSTVEEILLACHGRGKFVKLMKLTVGLAIGSDAIEMTLLSYLVPCVAAEWGLSSLQEALLTASVFAGKLVGTIMLGVMSDALGRRPAFQVAAMFVVVFGVLTSFAPSFWWLLACRSLVGVGAGGMEVPFNLLAETVSHKEKMRAFVDVQASWAIGSIFVGVAAWGVLSFGYTWRLFALVSALPPFGVLCCFGFTPESPRWLIAKGREEDAELVLRKIAKINGLELTDVTIVPEEKYHYKKGGGGMLSLWRRRELRSRTAASCVVWAAFGFTYYGVVLLSSKLSSSIRGVSEECSFDYPVLFLAASSELVANTVTRLNVGRLDSYMSLKISFVTAAVTTVVMPANSSLAWLLITSYFARGAAYLTACFSWIITPQLYPTEIRSTGHAASNASTLIGAVGASFLVSTSASNQWIAVGVSVVSAVGGLATQVLSHVCRKELDDNRGEDATESEPLL